LIVILKTIIKLLSPSSSIITVLHINQIVVDRDRQVLVALLVEQASINPVRCRVIARMEYPPATSSKAASQHFIERCIQYTDQQHIEIELRVQDQDGANYTPDVGANTTVNGIMHEYKRWFFQMFYMQQRIIYNTINNNNILYSFNTCWGVISFQQYGSFPELIDFNMGLYVFHDSDTLMSRMKHFLLDNFAHNSEALQVRLNLMNNPGRLFPLNQAERTAFTQALWQSNVVFPSMRRVLRLAHVQLNLAHVPDFTNMINVLDSFTYLNDRIIHKPAIRRTCFLIRGKIQQHNVLNFNTTSLILHEGMRAYVRAISNFISPTIQTLRDYLMSLVGINGRHQNLISSYGEVNVQFLPNPDYFDVPLP
jgi:hypothetical protein